MSQEASLSCFHYKRLTFGRTIIGRLKGTYHSEGSIYDFNSGDLMKTRSIVIKERKKKDEKGLAKAEQLPFRNQHK